MARTGWSTSNFLRYASGLVTAVPLSMACWFKTPTTGSTQTLMVASDSSVAPGNNCFRLRINSGDVINFTVNDTGSGVAGNSSTTISANTWMHACGVAASITSRAAYLDGSNKGTNSSSKTPSGINRFTIGVDDGSSQANAIAGAALIAEAAVWNIALSDADVAALATGLSPLKIHPEALVAYWPLIGNNSPENNLLSNTAVMSVQGSLSASAHPRVLLPHRRRSA